MKNILLTIITALMACTVQAQSYTTVDLYNYPNDIMYGETGYYYKDTQGYDGVHPVSGHREFGLKQNPNGTYTFYTRGTDRITTFFR